MPKRTLFVNDEKDEARLAGGRAERHDWGTPFVPSRSSYESVFVIPPEGVPAVAFPPELSGLTGVERLTIPYTLLPAIADVPWLDGLRSLTVAGPWVPASRYDKAHRWPGIRLPGLRALRVINAAEDLWPKMGFSGECFPDLSHIEVVAGGRTGLALLSSFPRLVHAEIRRAASLDVLAALAPSVQAVRIVTSGRNLPLGSLAALPALESLDLCGVRTQIDCAVFAGARSLAELRLWGCVRPVNPAALLTHPALRSVEIVACHRPVDADLRAAFEAHGFDNLSLDHQ